MKRERRKFTSEFKATVALEAIKEKLTMSELAQKYKVGPLQIKAWKKALMDNMPLVFGTAQNKVNQDLEQMSLLEQELYAQIGRLKMENEWLKKKVQ